MLNCIKMKNKIFGTLFGAALMITGFVSFNTADVQAFTPQEIELEEGGDKKYRNARNAYCDANYTVQGCKSENFRTCLNTVFCQ
jgi:hypothetical protein